MYNFIDNSTALFSLCITCVFVQVLHTITAVFLSNQIPFLCIDKTTWKYCGKTGYFQQFSPKCPVDNGLGVYIDLQCIKVFLVKRIVDKKGDTFQTCTAKKNKNCVDFKQGWVKGMSELFDCKSVSKALK